jgi:hypothetical protein
MRCTVRVNFESEKSGIKLATVEVEAGQLQTVVARAIRQAKKQHKGAQWNSVCILVERVDAAEPEQEAAA